MTLLHRRPTIGPRGWSTRPRPLLSRKAISMLIVVALAGGMFATVPPAPASADALSNAYAQQRALQRQIASQKAAIAALTASQSALSSKLSNTKATLTSVVSDLNVVRVDIVAMTVAVAQAQSSVDEMEATVAQLDSELADLERQERAKSDQLDARKAILADRIRSAYDTDRTSLFASLLSSGNFTDVLSEVSYHLDFADQDKALAEQIASDQQVLGVMHQTTDMARFQADQLRQQAAAQKASLDAQLADLAAAKAKLLDLQKQYEGLLAAQQAQYVQLAQSKAKLAAQLAAEAAAMKKLDALIDKLVLQAMQQGGIPSRYSGSLRWPMPGVVTQNFGCTGFYMEPPLGSCAHFHTGIDIANTSGTPIRAAGPGKVVFAGRSPYDPAYIVIIAHASNLVTWYAHVQTNIPVHVGQFVSAGQVIAFEGCTGWCTGPHLHWAVRLNSTWVNPRLFL